MDFYRARTERRLRRSVRDNAGDRVKIHFPPVEEIKMDFYRARTERRLQWSVRDNAGDRVQFVPLGPRALNIKRRKRT